MKNRSLVVALSVITTVLVVAGYFYQQHQQRIAREQAIQLHQQEQLILEQALESNSLAALERFIAEHPESDWLERAVYFRDKRRYEQAVNSADIQTLRRYLQQYPQSPWRQNVEKHVLKLEREQVNNITRQRIETKRKALIEQLEEIEPVQEQQEPDPLEAPATNTLATRPKPKDNPQDRVKRALSIYQNMHRQQRQQRESTRKQREREEQRAQECNQLNDQLKQFRNWRTRWYDLDQSGKRVYLTKKEVAKMKAELQQNFDKHCKP